MKRTALAFALFAPLAALAADYLISDPYTTTTGLPDNFTVTVDGGAPFTSPAFTQVDGTRILQLDLGPLNLSTGNHSFAIVAVKNSSGTDIGSTSPAASVTLKKTAVPAPVGISVRTK